VNPTIIDSAVNTLDSIVVEVEGTSDYQKDVLLEHLHAAKIYLMGSMPKEYLYSLNAAKQVAAELADPALQKRVKQQIEDLSPWA
jgi:hypothetical protein